MSRRKIFYTLFILLITSTFLPALALAQNESNVSNASEKIPLPFEVSVAPFQMVCLFFLSCPSFVPQNELIIIQTVNVNCGNQPINATTSLRIENSTGTIMKEKSENISLNASLEERPFSMYFSTYVPNGTYIAIAETNFSNVSVRVNRTFDIVKAAWNLTQRITIWTPARRIVRMEITPPRIRLNVSRGNTLLVPIEVRNTGTVVLKNVSIDPTVPAGWNKTIAYIGSLPLNQTVTRNIGITPGIDVRPASYLVLVEGKYNGETLDTDFFTIRVIREGNGSISIEEYPVIFEVEQETAKNFSVLVKNTGNMSLHDVTLQLENEERCIFPYNFPIKEELGVGETTYISSEIIPKSVITTCNATVIVISDEGAVSTATIIIKVRRRMGFPATLILEAMKFVTENPILVIFSFILIVITVRVINHMRYKSRREEEVPKE
jgi:hypothetical protein